MRVIKITEHKKDKMSDYAEKALKSMGKLMQCIEDLDEDDMGERYDEDDDDDDMGYRQGGGGNYGGGGSGGSMGGSMGERRRRSRRTGRFM